MDQWPITKQDVKRAWDAFHTAFDQLSVYPITDDKHTIATARLHEAEEVQRKYNEQEKS